MESCKGKWSSDMFKSFLGFLFDNCCCPFEIAEQEDTQKRTFTCWINSQLAKVREKRANSAPRLCKLLLLLRQFGSQKWHWWHVKGWKAVLNVTLVLFSHMCYSFLTQKGTTFVKDMGEGAIKIFKATTNLLSNEMKIIMIHINWVLCVRHCPTLFKCIEAPWLMGFRPNKPIIVWKYCVKN